MFVGPKQLMGLKRIFSDGATLPTMGDFTTDYTELDTSNILSATGATEITVIDPVSGAHQERGLYRNFGSNAFGSIDAEIDFKVAFSSLTNTAGARLCFANVATNPIATTDYFEVMALFRDGTNDIYYTLTSYNDPDFDTDDYTEGSVTHPVTRWFRLNINWGSDGATMKVYSDAWSTLITTLTITTLYDTGYSYFWPYYSGFTADGTGSSLVADSYMWS